MPEPNPLAKAQLVEIVMSQTDTREINSNRTVTVQFNPESLKVSYASQIKQPEGSGSGDQNGTIQFVGLGSTKLAVQLWFDVTQALPDADYDFIDVRELTARVAYFITPGTREGSSAKVPPAVRFRWGTFQFDGVVESMEETLELFSSEGRPLRASVGLNLTQQKVTEFAKVGKDHEPPKPKGAGAAGTRPMEEAPAGSNLQSLAAARPGAGDWQSIANANGIENPRALAPGQLIDFNARKPAEA